MKKKNTFRHFDNKLQESLKLPHSKVKLNDFHSQNSIYKEISHFDVPKNFFKRLTIPQMIFECFITN